jgi:hypothetical protein
MAGEVAQTSRASRIRIFAERDSSLIDKDAYALLQSITEWSLVRVGLLRFS